MKRMNLKDISLTLISLFICLLFFELIARNIILPSNESYDIFFGRELPPVKLVPHHLPFGRNNFNKWHNNLIVGDKKITKGDLGGIIKEDKKLGFEPEENAISYNGWWQSNNFGARSRSFTRTQVPLGKKRIIAFGDSFTNCDGVPQEETWIYFLNRKDRDYEIINFGVSGYNTCQNFLRYKKIVNEIEYDVVLISFVPGLNLWQDINSLRSLRGWAGYQLMPRYVVIGDKLKLITSLYETRDSFYESNGEKPEDKLKKYLRTYDRFYFRTKYESPPVVGNLIFYKLLAKKYYGLQTIYLLNNLMKKNSEAVQVSRKIFESANKLAINNGKKFVLIIIPWRGEIKNYVNDISFRMRWDEMISTICAKNLVCIDLMAEFSKIPLKDLDRVYDGRHYGPKANKLIAEFLWRNLKSLNII